MKIAITGGTGFLGRYIVRQLAQGGHELNCWSRESSDRSGFDAVAPQIDWVLGSLADSDSVPPLVKGCDALVHAALDRPGSGFVGAEGDIVTFAERNVLGTLRLIEAAKAAGVQRVIYIATCAVHDVILNDRPLDETHPTWAKTHYGAHKAAVETFVYSYGLGEKYPICSLRPCGIYGMDQPASESKWFELVRQVASGETVECRKGGKEVHAADVAKAAELLLSVPEETMRGQAFNCCDRYVSQYEVATLAKEFSSSDAKIEGEITKPKNQIETGKLRSLGFTFGGEALLKQTIKELTAAAMGTPAKSSSAS